MIGPVLNLHSEGRVFFGGFLPLGLKSEFSILIDELPTKATSLLRRFQNIQNKCLRRQPLAFVPESVIHDPAA